MRRFKDDRGRSYCDVFPISKGDINVSTLYPGAIKAFHRHQKQDDYWFVAKGHLRVVLAEDHEQFVQWNGISPLYSMDTYTLQNGIYTKTPTVSITTSGGTASSCWVPTVTGPFFVKQNTPKITVKYLSAGNNPLHIPAGIWHGVENVGTSEAIMLYWITEKYNAEEPDEERAPWDSYFKWEPTLK